MLFSYSLFLHAIQKYNTIRMIDELIRYPIYLASPFGMTPISVGILFHIPLQLRKQF